MNITQADDKNVSDAEDNNTNVDERTLRALEEYLTVLPDAVDAPGMVKVVSHTGEEYVVDVHGGNCECPDATWRLDEDTPCKHARRSRFALGIDPIPAEALEAAEVEPNFGAFIEEDAVRVATTDGGCESVDSQANENAQRSRDGVVEAKDEEDETDECEECAELSGMPCFECYMAERGFEV